MNAHNATPLSELVLAHALRKLGADRGSLMFLDAGRDELRIRAARGLSQQVMKHARVPVGEGLSGSVARSRQPLTVGPGTVHGSRRELSHPDLFRSYLMPIQVEEDLFGVLNASHTTEVNGARAANALDDLQRLTTEVAPCLAYEWLAGTESPVLSPKALTALGSESAVTQALRSVAALAVDLTRSQVVALVFASLDEGRACGGVMARRNTDRGIQLEQEVRLRLEAEVAQGAEAPGQRRQAALPKSLRLPELRTCCPVNCHRATVGWLCVYASPSLGGEASETVTESLAAVCSILMEQSSRCRRLGGVSVTTAGPSSHPAMIPRSTFDALITTVCHEVNNAACGILGIAELLQLRPDLADDVLRRLADIEGGAARIGRFTKGIARLRGVADPTLIEVSGTELIAWDTDTDDAAATPLAERPPPETPAEFARRIPPDKR